MGSKSFVSLMLAAITLGNAYASPPSDITLDYDAANESLHVTAQHPTDRQNRYFLRRIVIYKNGAEETAANFGFQRLAWGIDEQLPLKAQPGDRIKAEIFCSQGGSGEAEMTVPETPADNGQAQP